MDKRLRGWATFSGPPLRFAQHMSDRKYFFLCNCAMGAVRWYKGNISNTRESVSSGYPNTERWVEKTRCSRVFLTDFQVFGYLMKHSIDFLIWLLKLFIILGEIQSKSSQNFMLTEIRYPNHRHGGDFLCFLFMHYL